MPFEIRYGNPYAVPGVGEGLTNAALQEKSFARRIEEARLSLAARAQDLQESRQIMEMDQNTVENEYKRRALKYNENLRRDTLEQNKREFTQTMGQRDEDQQIRLDDQKLRKDDLVFRQKEKTLQDTQNQQNWLNEVSVKGGLHLSPQDEQDYQDYKKLSNLPASQLAAPDTARLTSLKDKFKDTEGFVPVRNVTGQVALMPTESTQKIKAIKEDFKLKKQIEAELQSEKDMNPAEIAKQMYKTDETQVEELNRQMKELQKDLSKNKEEYSIVDAKMSSGYKTLEAEIEAEKKKVGIVFKDKKAEQRVQELEQKLKDYENSYVNPGKQKYDELTALKKTSDSILNRMSDPKTYTIISDTRKKAADFLRNNENLDPSDRRIIQSMIINLGGPNWKDILPKLQTILDSKPGDKSK